MTTNPEVEQLKAQLAEVSTQLERWERQLTTSDERFAAAEAASTGYQPGVGQGHGPGDGETGNPTIQQSNKETETA